MASFTTEKTLYKGFTYWIEGEPKPDGSGGTYQFFVQHKSLGKKAIPSKQNFERVVPANQAARAAIDTYTNAIASNLPVTTDW